MITEDRRPRVRGQQGAATVLVLNMSGVLLLVGAALGATTALVVDHRTAQAAADLAALAAARTLTDGGDACATGAAVAADNRASLTACEVSGADVTLAVTVPGPRWLGQRHDLSAQARAGPDVSARGAGAAAARTTDQSVRRLLSSAARMSSSV